LVAFGCLTVLVDVRVPIPFDQALSNAARGWTSLTWAWRFLSDSANLPLIAMGVGIVIWLLLTRRRREAVVVVVLLAAITAGSEAVKQVVARPRPPGSDTVVAGVVYSYASGHVLEALTIYGIIAVEVWRSRIPRPAALFVAILAATVVGLVAVARVAIGAHYPSDVLGGALAGLGCLALYAWLTRPGGIADHTRDRGSPRRPLRAWRVTMGHRAVSGG
jgi:undecaprenyl-diphosphatase